MRVNVNILQPNKVITVKVETIDGLQDSPNQHVDGRSLVHVVR